MQVQKKPTCKPIKPDHPPDHPPTKPAQPTRPLELINGRLADGLSVNLFSTDRQRIYPISDPPDPNPPLLTLTREECWLSGGSSFHLYSLSLEDLHLIYTHFIFYSPILSNFFFFMFVEKVIEYWYFYTYKWYFGIILIQKYHYLMQQFLISDIFVSNVTKIYL